MTDDHIERIVRAYEQFKDEPGFTRVATLEEIRAKGGILSIPLYVAPAANGTSDSNSAAAGQPGLSALWTAGWKVHRRCGQSLVKLFEKRSAGRSEEVTEGINCPPGEIYFGHENPKGELGFYIHSRGGGVPYRLKIRSPSFCNLSILSHLLPGHMLSDGNPILGSLDFVMGECDR